MNETNYLGKKNVHISRASDNFLGSIYSLLKEVKRWMRKQRALTVLSNQTIAQSFLTCIDPTKT